MSETPSIRMWFDWLIRLAFCFLYAALPAFAHAAWTTTTVAGQESMVLADPPELVSLAGSARVLAVGSKTRPGITVLSVDTGEQIASLTLTQAPQALVLDSAGKTAYVAYGNTGAVSVIDVATARVKSTLSINGQAVALALRPDGNELVVADYANKRLVGLNPVSGAVTRTKAVAGNPSKLSFNPLDSRLLVAMDDTVVTLDVNWKALSSVDVGESVSSLDWWQNGGLAIAASQENDRIVLVDINRNTVLSQLPLFGDPSQLSMDQGNSVGYVATNRDNSVNLVDMKTPKVNGRYPVASRIGGLVIDSLARVLIVTQPEINQVVKLDPQLSNLGAALQLAQEPVDVKINNVTDQVLSINKVTSLLVVSSLGNGGSKSIKLNAIPQLLAMDTGKNIAIVATNAGIMFVDPVTRGSKVAAKTARIPIAALATDSVRNLSVAIAADPNAGALVLSNASSKLIGTVATPYRYIDLALHTGAGIAYLISDNQKLALLDLTTQKITKHVALGFSPRHIAIDEKLNLAVITDALADQVHVLDLATLTATASFPLPSHPGAVAIQTDSHTAVVASQWSNTLSTIDLSASTVNAGAINVPSPFKLDVSAQHNKVAVLSAEQDTVSLVSIPAPGPQLTDLQPRSVPLGSPGFVLQVSGKNFPNNAQVNFGATALVTRWKSAQLLEADVPASLLTTGQTIPVSVSVPGGATSNSLNFDVLNPIPTLVSVTPTALLANGQAQTITLSGSNFIKTSQAYFGAQPLATTWVNSGSLTAVVPGTLLQLSGTAAVTVFTPAPGGGISSPVQVSIVGNAPTVTGFTPTSGPVGSIVTITGSNFDGLNPGANDVRFNNVSALVSSAAASQLVVVVPVKATTGPISVRTQGGSATSATPFTVTPQSSFDLSVAPSAVQLPLGGNAGVRISLSSVGPNPYQQPVSIAASGLPSGVTVQLDSPNVYLSRNALMTFIASSSASPGTYTITISGSGPVDLQTLTRSKQISLTVLAAATSVGGRVLHTEDDSPFVGARVVLGTQVTTTDATGSYLFVNPTVSGDQVLRIDGAPQNTATTQYSSAIAMPVMIVPGQDNRALTSYVQAIDVNKYVAVTPGAEAHVTMPEIPNYELRIPAGATLYGWDGTPVTKINVRTVAPDKLPIRPIPPGVNTKTVYLYYFFREGGATPTQPIPVTMNNDIDALPGEKVDLYYYDESLTPDPNSNQWRIMGQGTVTQDGKSVVSDPGVGIPKFCCGASFVATNQAPPPPPPRCPVDGNPVALSSGSATVIEPKRFGLPGAKLPVNISCGYSAVNPVIGFFGLGTYFNYDWRAQQSGSQAMLVISPRGERYNLSLDSDGVYRARTGNPGGFGMEGSVTLSGIKLRMKNGTVFEFSPNGFLTAQQDSNGNRITITRNTLNYATSLSDANGQSYTFTTAVIQIGNAFYTVATKVTDPVGRSLQFNYDALARLTSTTDAAGQTVSYVYGASNQIVQKTDERSAVTQYQYDVAGRAVKETLPDGATYQFDYTLAGTTIVETHVTDPNGHVTTHRFNGQGFEEKVIDALGQQTTRQIDYATNQVVAETDALFRTTRYTYDDHGNMTSVVDPAGNTSIVEFDQTWNKPTRITNALGLASTFTYDDRGNLTKAANANGETITLTYTPQGLPASVTDALKHTTNFTYDDKGNLVSVADVLGNTGRARYDAASRLVEAVDARGRSTLFNYDPLNRITQVTDALGGLTKLAYDARSNLLSVVDANSHAIETDAYDLRDRLVQRTDASNKGERYQYDGVGNLVQKTDRNGRTTGYQYDAINRIIQVSDADGRVTTVSYDLAGNISRLSDTASGDILFGYDVLDRLTRIVTNQGTVEYQYDALGRRTQRTIDGNDPLTYAYDKANRLTTLSYRGQTVSYSYDAAGRLTSRLLPNGLTQSYNYDNANRVTSITYTKTDGTVLESIAYGYDANGNPVSRTGSVGPKTETPFSAVYDAGNRMTSITFTATGETFTLSYDANGNLLTKQSSTNPANTTTYTWDARNQLTSISGPNGVASFKYDTFGRRIEKTVSGQTTQFLYDGVQAIGELAGNTLGTTYLTGLQVDEVLARYTNQGSRTYLTDALGSVLAQTQSDQTVLGRYAYSPYGETQALGPDEGNPTQYTSRENDQTGLYYYRARYYDPQLKRFIAEDPDGIYGGINYYAYVYGRPMQAVDPHGKFLVPLAIGLYYTVANAILFCAADQPCVNAVNAWVESLVSGFLDESTGNSPCENMESQNQYMKDLLKNFFKPLRDDFLDYVKSQYPSNTAKKSPSDGSTIGPDLNFKR